MNSYSIKINRDINECPTAEVTNNTWNYPYAPKMTAQMTYDTDKGIIVKLTCFEKEPFTRYTKPYDPVYTDSCMECFFNLFPKKSKDYINLETNSNGAYIFSFGPGRGDVRTHILPKLGIAPQIKITKTSEVWTADIIIGNDALRAVYGDFEIYSGHKFIGNFYKCGDLTVQEHYLAWNPMTCATPAFHRPFEFGMLVFE